MKDKLKSLLFWFSCVFVGLAIATVVSRHAQWCGASENITRTKDRSVYRSGRFDDLAVYSFFRADHEPDESLRAQARVFHVCMTSPGIKEKCRDDDPLLKYECAKKLFDAECRRILKAHVDFYRNHRDAFSRALDLRRSKSGPGRGK